MYTETQGAPGEAQERDVPRLSGLMKEIGTEGESSWIRGVREVKTDG